MTMSTSMAPLEQDAALEQARERRRLNEREDDRPEVVEPRSVAQPAIRIGAEDEQVGIRPLVRWILAASA
jgi:hypothetical protein